MVRKIKRESFLGKNLLLACVIIALSTAGISYAYWTSGMNIMTLVRTGNLDVQFDPDTAYEVVNGSGNLTVTFEDPRTILIGGTIEEAVKEVTEETEEATIIRPEYSNHYGLFKFRIVNKGRVPVELVDKKLENADGNVDDGQESQTILLYPQDSNGSNAADQELCIQAGADKEAIDFKVDFMFNQPK